MIHEDYASVRASELRWHQYRRSKVSMSKTLCLTFPMESSTTINASLEQDLKMEMLLVG